MVLVRKKILIGVTAGLAVAAGLFAFLEFGSQPPFIAQTPAPLPESEEDMLGARLYEESRNPMKDEMPQTNPFAKETNPLKNVYQNPFE